jgi:hypothetical protein
MLKKEDEVGVGTLGLGFWDLDAGFTGTGDQREQTIFLSKFRAI